jgi:hypothetical protein
MTLGHARLSIPGEVDPVELGVKHQEADNGPLELETRGKELRAQALQDRAGVDPLQRLSVQPGHDRHWSHPV